MKLQPTYKIGDRVQYNSKACTAAALGTIVDINNDKVPHIYTVTSDLFKDDPAQYDKLEEQHIYGAI